MHFLLSNGHAKDKKVIVQYSSGILELV